MSAARNNKGSYLSRILPEQRIYVKTGESHTRYFKLGSKAQAGLACVAFLGVSWVIVASSALLLNWVSADSEAHQSQVMRDAYEARIAALSEERDNRTREAAAVQDRFHLALAEISRNQTELMRMQENRRELMAALATMRQKFGRAIDGRDLARSEADALSTELRQLASRFENQSGTETDLSDTLNTISTALSDVVQDRDSSKERLISLEDELAGLEFRERVNADRQERIFSQLEDAVLITLDPLEKLLEASGKDVEVLLEQVRRQYSGSGGPFIPAALPLGTEGDETGERFRLLMDKFDRAHLLQVAAAKMPLFMPVKGGVRHTSGFGQRRDPITGRARAHNGQDLAGSPGTPILATGDGTVITAMRQSGYGNVVKIRHAFGYTTVYAHLNKITVKQGEKVTQGDVIGGMGNTGRSTGTHLHYEIRIDGKPVNPMPYMKAARNVF
jgi:murein DD-endopeptidase MepM/ murein hydrolase activator NlpD